MPRRAPELECSVEDKESLVALAKSRTAESRAVERARMILACLEGKEIQQVARELRVSVPSVSKWRQRFSLWGLRGLCDRSRPGKPVRYDTAFRNRVLALLEETPPPGMSHWDGPAVAEKLDASVHAVWRVLRREGIYLQRRRSWCVSTDKEFAPKAAEVVGLYLSPPVNAVVLSVDENGLVATDGLLAIEGRSPVFCIPLGDQRKFGFAVYKRMIEEKIKDFAKTGHVMKDDDNIEIVLITAFADTYKCPSAAAPRK